MANLKPFDPDKFTCAHWTLPLGAAVVVTNLRNQKQVWVTVTDRGPAKWTGCTIDLSRAAFDQIEGRDAGYCIVTIKLSR
jgi:rare lipoprotein A